MMINTAPAAETAKQTPQSVKIICAIGSEKDLRLSSGDMPKPRGARRNPSEHVEGCVDGKAAAHTLLPRRNPAMSVCTRTTASQ